MKQFLYLTGRILNQKYKFDNYHDYITWVRSVNTHATVGKTPINIKEIIFIETSTFEEDYVVYLKAYMEQHFLKKKIIPFLEQ